MDIYQTLFSSSMKLNEQFAQELFEIVPEQGILSVVLDREGNSWLSDTELFESLNISESLISQLCARVDDGVDPAIVQVQEHCFIASQLAGVQGDYGHVLLILPQFSQESSLISINLIEMLLNQFRLIVRLLEKNYKFYDIQIQRYQQISNCKIPSN
jgi:hypothetical protein